MAETDFVQSGSGLWHLRGAEGDHLSERIEGRKLPQHKARALATLRKLKVLLRGCSGGDARGAEEGAKPHNRPRLAARRTGAPKLRRTAKFCARRAAKIQGTSHAGGRKIFCAVLYCFNGLIAPRRD